MEEYFPADYASQIFAYASILYANGFVHLDQVQGYYEQNWLSQEYKRLPFKMGKTAPGTLLDSLGGGQQGSSDTRMLQFMAHLLRLLLTAMRSGPVPMKTTLEKPDINSAVSKRTRSISL